MSVTFRCYNDSAVNGIVYLCDEHPEIYGVHEGLAHHWTDFSGLCKHLARKECGMSGDLLCSSRSDDCDGVEVFNVTVKEAAR